MTEHTDGVPMTEHTGWLDVGRPGLRWWSSHPVVVAPVAFAVADGVVVETDVAEPGRVLGWALRSGDDLATAELLFGTPWRRAVQDALATGERTVAAPPALPASWARYALVRGVRRWLPLDLDERMLGLDLALAAHGVGRADEAAGLLSDLWATLAYRMEECADGELTPALRPGLLAAARATGELLPGTRAAAQVAARAVELETAVILDAAAATGWPALVGERRGPSAERGTSNAPDLMTRVDPRLVPARVVRWWGARDAALTGVGTASGTSARLELAPGADPGDGAVGGLLVSLVDDATGLVLASAPLAGAEGTGFAEAELPVRGEPGLTSLQVHLGTTEHPFRVGPVGRRLVQVDRRLLEAWTDRRCGLAARSVVNKAVEELDDLAGTIELADGGSAAAGLRRRADRPTAADVHARREAVERYFGSGPEPAGSMDALIAEQVYLTGDDDR